MPGWPATGWWIPDGTTGRYHGARLAGDRLVDGRYEPIAIKELEDGVLEGYSAVLNLRIRWEQGELHWHDPATGRHILTYDDQRDRAESERDARLQAAARAEAAEARAESAEARAEQLEAELRRLRES